MDWFSRIIEAVKLFFSTRITIGRVMTSGFLLFFDGYFPFLEEIIKTYEPTKPVNAIIFIFTAILIMYDIATTKTIISKLKMFRIKRKINSLNEDEKAILREFFIQNEEEIKLPINNPIVSGLIEKGILSTTRYYVKNLPVGVIQYVVINYEARKLLDLRLIGWPEIKPTEKELDIIMKNRPQFIRIIKSESPIRDW